MQHTDGDPVQHARGELLHCGEVNHGHGRETSGDCQLLLLQLAGRGIPYLTFFSQI